ncbi:hypothetical protein LIER_10044 [Lithospermum erythrorhizon]|uniref:DUF3444 domain-containing protein n=1 Tax=Lithospermum erythrorhizon TaxID=34254 RepID=A0AAV3PI23_LITER
MPNNTTAYCATNGVAGYHPGSEYPSNITIQFDSFPGTPADGMDLNGFSTSTYEKHQLNGKTNRAKTNAKDSIENPVSKPDWSAKKRKLSTESSVRRHSSAPAFDVRQLLIDKARSDIRKKVEEMRVAAEAEKKNKALAEVVIMSAEALKTSESNSTIHQSKLKRTVSMSITESEFGSVNWLGSGFTKSCGSFRVFHSETVEQVNIFSHLLSKEKAGRGGCVRIYPRSGDIWTVYRNWSPDWNRHSG